MEVAWNFILYTWVWIGVGVFEYISRKYAYECTMICMNAPSMWPWSRPGLQKTPQSAWHSDDGRSIPETGKPGSSIFCCLPRTYNKVWLGDPTCNPPYVLLRNQEAIPTHTNHPLYRQETRPRSDSSRCQSAPKRAATGSNGCHAAEHLQESQNTECMVLFELPKRVVLSILIHCIS